MLLKYLQIYLVLGCVNYLTDELEKSENCLFAGKWAFSMLPLETLLITAETKSAFDFIVLPGVSCCDISCFFFCAISFALSRYQLALISFGVKEAIFVP